MVRQFVAFLSGSVSGRRAVGVTQVDVRVPGAQAG